MTAEIGYPCGMQNPLKIAILATGDEIINGDIMNTNGQFIAQTLFDNDVQPGMQLTSSDDQAELENAMSYLLSQHDAMITIGGLGPTSDDRTRFALGQVLGRELIFDEMSWQQIKERLKSFDLSVPDSNRQQCLFPEGAEILDNQNGTANGCFIEHDGKQIFMLPGPPRECRALFDTVVLPRFIANHHGGKLHRASWLLLGICEGQLAEPLDAIAANENVQVGYRASSPYVEVKLFSRDSAAFDKVKTKFLSLISPFIISQDKQTATQLLYNYIQRQNKRITIIDNATKGYLSSKLLTPDTYEKLRFPEHPTHNSDVTFIVSGLRRFWNQEDAPKFNIEIMLLKPQQPAQGISFKIPNRKERTLPVAIEHICARVLKLLSR